MASGEEKSPGQLREELLSQLGYLVHEIDSLKGIVERVPANLLEGRPLKGDLSIKETYALLCLMDENVHFPFVRAIRNDEQFEEVKDQRELISRGGWNEEPITNILGRLQKARRSLISVARQVDDRLWTRKGEVHGTEMNLFELIHFITQHDVDRMREIGYRLHESQMSPTNS